VLTGEDRHTLLALARRAIEARVAGLDLPEPGAVSGLLALPGAAFVSVHLGPQLRGCLGCIEPRGPSLAAVVARMAAAAASADPRFSPLGPEELDRTTVEISVLGPLLPVSDHREIRVGRDGLVIERDGYRGLLLPQVPVEWGWDVETFLAETSRKAALPRDAWRHGALIWRFEAEVFADEPPSRAPAVP
jgi:AmmeMemoRadiSam system protein A